MLDISRKSVNIFLDFNAVVVNLDYLPEESQRECLESIADNVGVLKAYLEENMERKEQASKIPETGKAVLKQQLILVRAIEEWLQSVGVVSQAIAFVEENLNDRRRAGTDCEGVSLFQVPSAQDVHRGGGDATLRIYNQTPAYRVCGLRSLRRRR